jgi:hypothetical protein
VIIKVKRLGCNPAGQSHGRNSRHAQVQAERVAGECGSFGILAGEDAFARGRDERMDYLDRLAGA